MGSRLRSDIETGKRGFDDKGEYTRERLARITVVLFIHKHVAKVFAVETRRSQDETKKRTGREMLRNEKENLMSPLDVPQFIYSAGQNYGGSYIFHAP